MARAQANRGNVTVRQRQIHNDMNWRGVTEPQSFYCLACVKVWRESIVSSNCKLGMWITLLWGSKPLRMKRASTQTQSTAHTHTAHTAHTHCTHTQLTQRGGWHGWCTRKLYIFTSHFVLFLTILFWRGAPVLPLHVVIDSSPRVSGDPAQQSTNPLWS